MTAFKLQSVLNYRQRVEELAQRTLAESLQYEKQCRRDQASLTRQLNQTQEDMAQRQRSGVGALDLLEHNRRVDYLRTQIESAGEQLSLAVDQVRGCREELLTASREKKLIEKLKERQKRRERDHLMQKETRQLDEISVLFYKREERI